VRATPARPASSARASTGWPTRGRRRSRGRQGWPGRARGRDHQQDPVRRCRQGVRRDAARALAPLGRGRKRRQPLDTGVRPAGPAGLNAAYSNIINDVTFQPGTNGRTILVNAAWRAGASYNGFYISRDAGATWTKANPGGAINPKEIGNAEFAYSADGKKLYTVVESIFLYNKGIQNGSSVLAGVYASNNGSVDGPWTLIADYKKLQQSGSALFYKGFAPGVQAWYNNFIAVDPKNANHVYLGLEEVFETWNGGSNWTATGRYWNFGFSCWSFDDAANTCDGNVMHSDQHSIAFTPDGSKVFVGNDGGVYSKSTSTKVGWTNYNKNGLNTLQYYGVGAGRVGSAVAVSGGLQDNGGSLLRTDMTDMVSNFGGDGGEIIVDPKNGCRIVGEYVGLTLYRTENCAKSKGDVATVTTIAPPDPAPRFIAPFGADIKNIEHWVAAATSCGPRTRAGRPSAVTGSWPARSARARTAHSGRPTAVAKSGNTIYAPWCGGGCNPGAAFERGVYKIKGAAKAQLPMTGLPNRYIDAVSIDPATPSTSTSCSAASRGSSPRARVRRRPARVTSTSPPTAVRPGS
jgi:hypothetical protein